MGMRSIYRKVARENGVSVAEVKREIQVMIEDAWENPPNDGGVTKACQRQVQYSGKIPTPDELIRYAAAVLKQEEL